MAPAVRRFAREARGYWRFQRAKTRRRKLGAEGLAERQELPANHLQYRLLFLIGLKFQKTRIAAPLALSPKRREERGHEGLRQAKRPAALRERICRELPAPAGRRPVQFVDKTNFATKVVPHQRDLRPSELRNGSMAPPATASVAPVKT